MTAQPIRPGDRVEHIHKPDLDVRTVVAVGDGWLTLNLLGLESSRLPIENYRTVRRVVRPVEFDPGNPISNGEYLLDDYDGAPLPHELQRDGRIWKAIREAAMLQPSGGTADEIANDACRMLAPILWPLLPSNDGRS